MTHPTCLCPKLDCPVHREKKCDNPNHPVGASCQISHPSTPQPSTQEWEKFEKFAIECGVPSSVFWKDAEHCSCFFEDEGKGLLIGMKKMYENYSLLASERSQLINKLHTEIQEKSRPMKKGEVGMGINEIMDVLKTYV